VLVELRIKQVQIRDYPLLFATFVFAKDNEYVSMHNNFGGKSVKEI
jgi:hypothetical protein